MRQIVTAKDIQNYFGKKESMSFKMLRQMKNDLGKMRHQPITINEFCTYYAVDRESVMEVIQNDEKKKQTENTVNAHTAINNNTSEPTTVHIPKNETYVFSKRTW